MLFSKFLLLWSKSVLSEVLGWALGSFQEAFVWSYRERDSRGKKSALQMWGWEGNLNATWFIPSSNLTPENKSLCLLLPLKNSSAIIDVLCQAVPCLQPTLSMCSHIMAWKNGPVIIPILQMRKRRHREMDYPAYIHSSAKWQKIDANARSLILETTAPSLYSALMVES